LSDIVTIELTDSQVEQNLGFQKRLTIFACIERMRSGDTMRRSKKDAREANRKPTSIHERSSGIRRIKISNDNGYYTLEVWDDGKKTRVIPFTDLSKAMATSKKLLQEMHSDAKTESGMMKNREL
jgi:hypothetical protein